MQQGGGQNQAFFACTRNICYIFVSFLEPNRTKAVGMVL